jgi:N-acetyl-alpha-D-muramate 1-phosphate uridylyltransferase
MADSLAGRPASSDAVSDRSHVTAAVVLAAGAGRRLWPLTSELPKALCPVGGRPLVDRAVDAVRSAVSDVAVNVHHGRELLEGHLGPAAVHVSVEEPEALGTAGAIGALRHWLAGRDVLVVNADTVHDADLVAFLTRWDGERVALLTPTPGPFGPSSAVVASLLPGDVAVGLTAEPSGLWERCWRDHVAAGRLVTVHHHGTVVDCAGPVDYLRANLWVSGGAPVVDRGAVVEGVVERSVVWAGANVGAAERLVDAIRTPRRTVLVRGLSGA